MPPISSAVLLIRQVLQQPCPVAGEYHRQRRARSLRSSLVYASACTAVDSWPKRLAAAIELNLQPSLTRRLAASLPTCVASDKAARIATGPFANLGRARPLLRLLASGRSGA
jgi:hypothetical protein